MYLLPSLIFGRITPRSHYHANTGSASPLYIAGSQIAFSRSHQDLTQIEIHACHDRLSLRIAEPAIEFQHLRPVVSEHKAEVEEAAIGPALICERGHCGPHHILENLNLSVF